MVLIYTYPIHYILEGKLSSLTWGVHGLIPIIPINCIYTLSNVSVLELCIHIDDWFVLDSDTRLLVVDGWILLYYIAKYIYNKYHIFLAD